MRGPKKDMNAKCTGSLPSGLAVFALFAASAMATQACGKNVSCNKLFSRNKECADAFEQYVLARSGSPGARPAASNPTKSGPPRPGNKAKDRSQPGEPTGKAAAPTRSAGQTKLPAAQRKAQQRRKTFAAAAKQLRSIYTSKAFLGRCNDAWFGNQSMDRRFKKEAARCLAMKSCDAYVRCMVSIRTPQPH
ncbi:MAG: hypothetical protein J7M25_06095 [Deltaproteobacteria bacterium]|nr:hypothetical protein [Deltaproteobacteria bacterium]